MSDWYLPIDKDAWRGSRHVGMLSLAARGLYFEVLLMMVDSPRPGYLCHPTGEPCTMAEVRREAKADAREFRRAIDKLLASGCLEMRDGALYNERAARDGERRQERREQARRAAEVRWSETEPEPKQADLLPVEDAPKPKPRTKKKDETPIVIPFCGVLDASGFPSDGGVTERQLEKLQKQNPALDVREFLEMMAGKLKAGSLRPPKATGLERACRNWLQRELQDGRSRFRRGPKPAAHGGGNKYRSKAGILLDFASAAYDDAEREANG